MGEAIVAFGPFLIQHSFFLPAMSPSAATVMPAPVLLSLVPLLGWMCAASWIDCTSRRIPNILTFTLLAGGLVRAAFLDMLGPACVGALVGLLLILPFFVIGAMGGGDVKLMAALGCWVMPAGVLDVFATAAVVAMGYVIWRSYRLGRLRQLWHNSGLLVLSMMQLQRLGKDQLVTNGRAFKTIDQRLPYAVPVTLASGLVVMGFGVARFL